MIKDDSWVINVAEGKITGSYKGYSVEIVGLTSIFDIYIESVFIDRVSVKSPVKAIYAAKAAIDSINQLLPVS